MASLAVASCLRAVRRSVTSATVASAVRRQQTAGVVCKSVTAAAQTRSFANLGMWNAPDGPLHKSDAQQRIDRVPPIVVDGPLAMCDGGGGATGHPLEYIQLDRRDGKLAGERQPEVCNYCGLRYVMSDNAHHGH